MHQPRSYTHLLLALQELLLPSHCCRLRTQFLFCRISLLTSCTFPKKTRRNLNLVLKVPSLGEHFFYPSSWGDLQSIHHHFLTLYMTYSVWLTLQAFVQDLTAFFGTGSRQPVQPWTLYYGLLRDCARGRTVHMIITSRSLLPITFIRFPISISTVQVLLKVERNSIDFQRTYERMTVTLF